MAEVGLVRFASVALELAEQIAPNYRSKYSKHLFTQPQLLVMLCLMRYEDWTFREAEVRLAEHRELRAALRLERSPDYTTLYRFLKRLDESLIEGVLRLTVKRLPGSGGGTSIAVDATGRAPGSISTFFVKRARDRGNGLPWLLAEVGGSCGHPRRIVLSQMARQGPSNDGAVLRSLTAAAGQLVDIGLVLADGEVDGERNHQHIREALGAFLVIPAKRGNKTWKLKGTRNEMRERCPQQVYAQRAIVESVFSAVKRKPSCRAPGRSVAMQRQAWL